MRSETFLLGVVLLASGVASAQAPAPAAAPAAPAAPTVTPPEPEAPVAAYTYEVGGRRDPFRSLLLRQQERVRDRLPGVAGMLVDELELQGTIRTKGGWIAMMRGTDNRSYLLRKGNTVFDGEVLDITGTDVTFRQNVNDPTNPKPFRDVTKSLALQKR